MKRSKLLLLATATVLMAVAMGQRATAQNHIRCDVNGDGVVDVADIATVISVMAESTDASLTKADVNGDSSVDVADIATIITAMADDTGNEISYTSCPDENHPHWIDLGLPSGTQWRCCNEGASRPEEYGGYYQFGQVASAPTLYQIEYLLYYCSYTWTTQNGVNGGKFTGPNGGSIFLPAAGDVWDGELRSVGMLGHYWSSTPDDEGNAVSLGFGSGTAYWSYGRYYDLGFTVRPVR